MNPTDLPKTNKPFKAPFNTYSSASDLKMNMIVNIMSEDQESKFNLKELYIPGETATIS